MSEKPINLIHVDMARIREVFEKEVAERALFELKLRLKLEQGTAFGQLLDKSKDLLTKMDSLEEAFPIQKSSARREAGGAVRFLKAAKWFVPRAQRDDWEFIISDLQEDRLAIKKERRSKRFVEAALWANAFWSILALYRRALSLGSSKFFSAFNIWKAFAKLFDKNDDRNNG